MAQRKAAGTRSDHGTKWTAEFVVAAELSRRGYTVAFTQGSHVPVYDLLAGTSTGEAFAVDVKGQAFKSAWLVRDKRARTNLFYILAFVPLGGEGREPDQLFILTQDEVRDLNVRYRVNHPNQSATSKEMGGFNFSDALPHKDAWHKLPPAK